MCPLLIEINTTLTFNKITSSVVKVSPLGEVCVCFLTVLRTQLSARFVEVSVGAYQRDLELRHTANGRNYDHVTSNFIRCFFF